MSPKISILIVTYGNRFIYSSRVIKACLNDNLLYELIIIDNASCDKNEILNLISKYEDKKIKYIRLEENTGSAGGFSKGMEYFLNTDSDYLLLLDDDNLPEDNFLNFYLNTINLFPNKEDVVLAGNRVDIQGFDGRFYNDLFLDFNHFGVNFFKSIKNFFYKKENKKEFKPIRFSNCFGYGGAFLNKKIIKKAGLPDFSFFLYTDDIDFSYRIFKKGFNISNIYRPFIHDIDLHNKDNGILSIFSENVKDFRVIYSCYNDAFFTFKNTDNIFIYFINFFIYYFYIILLLGFKNKLSIRNIKRLIFMFKNSLRGIKKALLYKYNGKIFN